MTSVGEDAAAFRSWTSELPPAVEVCAAQLPGRGKRMREPLVKRMDALIPSLVDAMRDGVVQPFAIFGHGLGALIAFELARALRRMSLPQPARLFLSAHRAPTLPSRFEDIHGMEESAFREELRRRADVPAEVLEHEELMAIVSPMLRADFETEETYTFSAEDPIDVPFTIFGGSADDTVKESELQAWREHTRAAFRVEMLPGDRFYPRTQRNELLRTISRELS
jgi:medium-chain acyl-[acyl-carrier-protein] hydrolase